MQLTKQKRAFLVKHMGEKRVKDLEDRLTNLSKELEAAGVAYKDRADPEMGDALLALLSAVEGGHRTLAEVREKVGPRVADALERVMAKQASQRKGLLQRSKDIPHSLDDIRANIAKAGELIARLDAKAQAEKDTSPIARYARMLGSKSKGRASAALKDDGNPITRYAQGLVQGQVEREGG